MNDYFLGMRLIPALKVTQPHLCLNCTTPNWGNSEIDPDNGQVYKSTGDKVDFPKYTIEQFHKIEEDSKISNLPKSRPKG